MTTKTKTADLRLELQPRDGGNAIPMEFPNEPWVCVQALMKAAREYAARGEFARIYVQRRDDFGYWRDTKTITVEITIKES
jgi:hypothetical protein